MDNWEISFEKAGVYTLFETGRHTTTCRINQGDKNYQLQSLAII